MYIEYIAAISTKLSCIVPNNRFALLIKLINFIQVCFISWV